MITEKVPGVVLRFEYEDKLLDALDKVKLWVPHRSWLLMNKVEFKEFPEEIEYQELVKEWSLVRKHKYV